MLGLLGHSNRNWVPGNHTERCRERIEQQLKKEPEGASKIARDRERIKRARHEELALKHAITDHCELQQRISPSIRPCVSSLSAVQVRALIGVQFPLVLMLLVLLHPAINSRSPSEARHALSFRFG